MFIYIVTGFIYFDELCGAKEITDFYNLVNSPNVNTSVKDDKNVQNVQGSPNVSIHSTLYSIKSLTLNISIRESSQEDSHCAIIEPVQSTVQHTLGTSTTQEEKEEDSITHTPLKSNKKKSKASKPKYIA